MKCEVEEGGRREEERAGQEMEREDRDWRREEWRRDEKEEEVGGGGGLLRIRSRCILVSRIRIRFIKRIRVAKNQLKSWRISTKINKNHKNISYIFSKLFNYLFNWIFTP